MGRSGRYNNRLFTQPLTLIRKSVRVTKGIEDYDEIERIKTYGKIMLYDTNLSTYNESDIPSRMLNIRIPKRTKPLELTPETDRILMNGDEYIITHITNEEYDSKYLDLKVRKV